MIEAFIVLWAICAVARAACSARKPLALLVNNVTIPNGNAIRGIPISVGTPPQNLSVDVQAYVQRARACWLALKRIADT